jgi:signal transduction histidine kinase
LGIRLRLLTVVLAGTLPLVIFLVAYNPARFETRILLLAILISVFFAVGAALLVAEIALRRIKLLDSASRQLGGGNYSVRLDANGTDEIAKVAATFNQMAEKLEEREHRFIELEDLKSEFVGRVSHELRTPLTTIKALTRLLLRNEIPEERQKEYLETISVECDRQIDLVLNLLDLSRIEGGVYRLDIQEVDVSALIRSCVKAEMYSAEKRGHKLEIKPFADVRPVRADPNALRRVILNLIENAIKYTDDGGFISISAAGTANVVNISLTDNGRGIPQEDLPILFDKFYRGERALASAQANSVSVGPNELDEGDDSGIGLGLYLARNVMEKMGGSISVETKLGRGSTFTLHLPAWNEENELVKGDGNGKSVVGS